MTSVGVSTITRDNYSPVFQISFEELRRIEYFDDAVNLLENYGMVSEVELRRLTGFGELAAEQKKLLVGIPFLILEYRFRDGQRPGDKYVDMYLITTTNQRWKMRDSSLGICEQLKQIHIDRIANGHPHPNFSVPVRRGLTYWETEYTDPETQLTTNPRTYSLSL